MFIVAVSWVEPKVAVTDADWTEPTANVATVKVTLVESTGTRTAAGTIAFELFEESRTDNPNAGAGPLKVTVPVSEVPPATEAGTRAMLTSVGGVTVSVAVWVAPPCVPVIVALVRAFTPVVAIGKVADVEPAAMVTVDGTVIFALLDERFTDAPPDDGAGAPRVTVPTEGLPPTTVDGDTVRETKPVAEIVRVWFWEVPPEEAVIVAEVPTRTGFVPTKKVAVDLPAGIVMNAGTFADELLDVSKTTFPPVGAGAERLTVPEDSFPPRIVEGFRTRLLIGVVLT
jgi:hypothetical protein